MYSIQGNCVGSESLQLCSSLNLFEKPDKRFGTLDVPGISWPSGVLYPLDITGVSLPYLSPITTPN